jgi:deaminated glutathione amidase
MRIALIQTRTGTDPAREVDVIAEHAAIAAQRGATFVLTPEGSNFLQRDRALFDQIVKSESDDLLLAEAPEIARNNALTLVIGSALVKRSDGKLANRCVAFGPDGARLGSYDKIHLFDVNLGPGAEHYESRVYTPGDQATLVSTPDGKVGLTICYDVRFPHLFRDLGKAGADIITVPAAFTVPTGRAHWEVLLRARAIETGAFILAAAQGGTHEDGRATWGHSMAINPWGEIIGQLEHDEPGLLIVDIDIEEVASARSRIPALTHDRPYGAAK